MAESICIRCGNPYRGRGALSRYDNKTYVCPTCGTLEGMWVAQNPDKQVPDFAVMLTTVP